MVHTKVYNDIVMYNGLQKPTNCKNTIKINPVVLRYKQISCSIAYDLRSVCSINVVHQLRMAEDVYSSYHYSTSDENLKW